MQIRRPRRHDVKGLLFAATLGIAGVAHATPLDPTSFASLGTLNVTSGSITINTDTLGITGAATFNGASFSQGGSNPQVAVFTFGSFNIGAGVTINVTGSRPLALLSQGSMSIASAISLNGGNAAVPTAGTAGPAGGYVGGTGGFTGSAGGGPGGGSGSGVGHDAGGGGYGGAGGNGTSDATPGISYGDPLTLLQGGSGGGGAGNAVDGNAGGGGGGGGAIELGAVGSLSLASGLASNGGSGANGLFDGGGGAGGGILLHAGTIAFTSLAATGGNASDTGGGGGGGRIALTGGILTAAQIASLVTSVNGGTGGVVRETGKAGVLTFHPDLATVQSTQSLNVGITPGQTGQTDPRIETLPKSLTIQSVGSATLVSPITWATGGVVSLTGGTLNVNNSSTFTTGSTLSWSSGSLIVGNGQTLAFDGGVASVTISAGLSDGATLRITNGGQLTSSSNFDIGFSGVAGAGWTGTLVVDGLNSSITTGGLAFTNWAPKDGDAATVTFSNQSTGTFGQGLVIASGNSTALVNLNSGATLNTASMQVGNGSPGSTATININGGALNVYLGPTTLRNGVVVNYSAGTFVNSGMLMLQNDSQILLSTGGDKVLRANGLSIASASKIDLADNDMIVHQGGSASRTTVRNALIIGRNGGAWTGNGITSSSVAADPSHKSLGYALASDLFGPGGGTFDGIPVAGNAVLVKYTFLGDANLDGIVNALDFNALATNFGASTNKFWNQGDFNDDGMTNTQDFTLLASNFGQAMSAPALGAPSPSP